MTPETEISYTTIIDSILAASDLNTISEKRIRKGLQAAVDYDITPLKVAMVEATASCNMLIRGLGANQGAHHDSIRQIHGRK